MWIPLVAPCVSPPASPTQRVVATDQVTVVAPSGISNPPAKDSSDKGKAQVQESGVGSEDPESFAAKHLSIV